MRIINELCHLEDSRQETLLNKTSRDCAQLYNMLNTHRFRCKTALLLFAGIIRRVAVSHASPHRMHRRIMMCVTY